jgi:hypothetical protein
MPGSTRSSPSKEKAKSMVTPPNFGLVYQMVLFMKPWLPTTVPASSASDDVPVSWLCMLM